MQNSSFAASVCATCKNCGKALEKDDIGATKKLINRGATEFFCVACLASHFDVTEELIRKKIEEFRAYGCTLFI